MSRKGDPWDNAVAESFFPTLKREEIDLTFYPDQHSARIAMTEYIKVYRNRKRKHSYPERVSPVRYREIYEKNVA